MRKGAIPGDAHSETRGRRGAAPQKQSRSGGSPAPTPWRRPAGAQGRRVLHSNETVSRTAQLRITSSQVPTICPSWPPARGLEAACEMPRMRQGAPAPPCLLVPGEHWAGLPGAAVGAGPHAPRGLLGGGPGLRGHAGGQLGGSGRLAPPPAPLRRGARAGGGGASRRYSYMPISPRHAR